MWSTAKTTRSNQSITSRSQHLHFTYSQLTKLISGKFFTAYSRSPPPRPPPTHTHTHKESFDHKTGSTTIKHIKDSPCSWKSETTNLAIMWFPYQQKFSPDVVWFWRFTEKLHPVCDVPCDKFSFFVFWVFIRPVLHHFVLKHWMEHLSGDSELINQHLRYLWTHFVSFHFFHRNSNHSKKNI